MIEKTLIQVLTNTMLCWRGSPSMVVLMAVKSRKESSIFPSFDKRDGAFYGSPDS